MTRFDRQCIPQKGDLVEVIGNFTRTIISSHYHTLKFIRRGDKTWQGNFESDNTLWKGTNGEKVFIVSKGDYFEVVPNTAVRVVKRVDKI